MANEVSNQPLVPPLEVFRFLREEIKHEYNVLGTRLTSYITSQSFLFATYGVSMSNPNQVWGPVFRLVCPAIVCSVGVLASVRAHPGIQSARDIINSLHARQMKLYEDPAVMALDPTDTEWMMKVHRQSLRFSQDRRVRAARSGRHRPRASRRQVAARVATA